MEGLAEKLAETLAEKGLAPNPAPKQEETPKGDIETAGGDAPKAEEATPKPGEEGETPPVEETAIEYLTDLAEHIGVEPDDIYNLKFKLADDGEAVALGEIKDRLQNAERQSGELEVGKQELERERAQMVGQLREISGQQKQLNEQGEQARAEMLIAQAEFDRIDWNELEKLDAGRAALEQQKLFQRYASAKDALDKAMAEQEQLDQTKFQQAKAYHDNELLKRVPDWRDADKAKEEINGIVNWMRSDYGFNDQEIGGTVDWRHRDILRKAFLYDKMQKNVGELPTKKENAPVVIRKGVSLKKGDANKQKVADLVKKARTSRDRGQKVAAARAVLDEAFKTG